MRLNVLPFIVVTASSGCRRRARRRLRALLTTLACFVVASSPVGAPARVRLKPPDLGEVVRHLDEWRLPARTGDGPGRAVGKGEVVDPRGLAVHGVPVQPERWEKWIDSVKRDPKASPRLLDELRQVEDPRARGLLLALDTDLGAIRSGGEQAEHLMAVRDAAGPTALLWRRRTPAGQLDTFDDAVRTLGLEPDGTHRLVARMREFTPERALHVYDNEIRQPLGEVLAAPADLRRGGFATADEAREYLRRLEDLTEDADVVEGVKAGGRARAAEVAGERIPGAARGGRRPVHVDDVIEQAEVAKKPEVAGWLRRHREAIVLWTGGLLTVGVLYRLALNETGTGPIGEVANEVAKGTAAMVKDTVRLLLSPVSGAVDGFVETVQSLWRPVVFGVVGLLLLLAIRRPLWAFLRLVFRGVPWPQRKEPSRKAVRLGADESSAMTEAPPPGSTEDHVPAASTAEPAAPSDRDGNQDPLF